MQQVAARYYDGRTARARPVTLVVDGDRAQLRGDGIDLAFELHELRVSDPIARSPRMVTLPDGSHCEIDDHAGFDALLAQTGYRESLIVRLQSSWRHVLAAIFAVIAVCAAGVWWGVPFAAAVIAQQVPAEFEAGLGEQAMRYFDSELMKPSALPEADRTRLAQRFAMIAPDDGRRYRLEFRSSRIGPNAFALPGGQIVITDELVQIAGGDEQALAAFAHELGHVHYRHTLRRLVAGAMVGSGAALLFGDWSSLLAFVPAMLVDLHYSRSMELEADGHAQALLARNGIPVQALIDMLQALESAQPGAATATPQPGEEKQAKQEKEPGPFLTRPLRYLSTHPATEERIARLRERAH